MELVENVYVSEFTKKTLEQFGWQEGHAIPADLGQIMIDMKETLPASKRSDVLVDKAVMSDEQIERVTGMLKEARERGEKKKRAAEIEEQTKNMDPSVSAVYKQLAEKDSDKPQIIDDREEAAAVKEEAAPAPTPTSPEAVEQKQEEEPQAEPMVPGVIYCPRCGWDLRQKFEIAPTQRDKEDFLATLLGASRFKKQYDLFGGKFVVTFRSLLAEENKLIYRQLVLDQRDNKVATEAEWFTQMMDYRLACALETIVDKSGKVITAVPTLEEMAFAGDKDQPLLTALPQQLSLVNKTLAQEATRRIVGMHLRQFQRLVEGLEAMALEPSFWTGIE